MNWVVSDIHGCFFTLEKLLENVYKIDSSALLIFIGDYIDRGKNSSSVISFLSNFKNAVFLRGNHDDVVDWLLNDHSLTDMSEMVRGIPSLYSVYLWWLQNGFGKTLESYGLQYYDQTFREKIPEEHKLFLKNTTLFWQNQTHFVCHAFWRPNEELPSSAILLKSDRIMECLWTRFSLVGQLPQTVWNKIGVFGHTPLDQYNAVSPIKHGKIRLIDGGAFKGNYLVAYCCEMDDWILQSADSRDIL